MATIRENLKRLRKAHGWSQETLGKKAGYANGGMIDRIEKGLTRPSYQQLLVLAHVFEVTVSDLVGDKAPCAVTNNANGAHAIGYQHNEGSALMTDELQATIRQVVREELTVQREQLVQEFRVVLREAAREADDAPGQEGAATRRPPEAG